MNLMKAVPKETTGEISSTQNDLGPYTEYNYCDLRVLNARQQPPVLADFQQLSHHLWQY
jgi:hypothetical protein